MKRQTRRNFITSASLLTLGTAANAIPMPTQEQPMVIHHVFFYLKNPKSIEDRDKLIEGVKTLAGISSVRKLHVGIPAKTPPRAVVESGYAVTELIFFDNVEGQNAYQEDPIHKQFVKDHAHLWKKVIVFDSETV